MKAQKYFFLEKLTTKLKLIKQEDMSLGKIDDNISDLYIYMGIFILIHRAIRFNVVQESRSYGYYQIFECNPIMILHVTFWFLSVTNL